MIAICKTEKVFNFTVDEGYLIYGGNYLTDEESGHKCIVEILTQDNNGSLVWVSAKSFLIIDMDFGKYIVKKDSFMFKCIGYEDFISNYYEDRPEKFEFYKKAQSDFFAAKLELYEELSEEMLEKRIMCATQDEQDFIFDYLRIKKNGNYINLAIERIRNAIDKNGKWYEVDKEFEYLASFQSKIVMDFFVEYLTEDYWENDTINNIIYTYFE